MGAFRFLTAGESHGPALGVTIEGVPAGLALTADAIAVDLARRQKGYGRGARQPIEQDRAEILGGVRHGLTLGSPILLLVRNRDWENWTQVMAVEPLDDEAAAALFAAAADGNKRATPVTRVRPGPRRPGRRPQVRLQRRPQRARARLGARDRGTGRGRRASRGPSCASSGSRSGRSPPRSAAWPSTRPTARARATRPTPRRCAARTRRPRSG